MKTSIFLVRLAIVAIIVAGIQAMQTEHYTRAILAIVSALSLCFVDIQIEMIYEQQNKFKK
jgi:type IV secretory pathway VirB2 component (pilin)